MAGLFVGAQSEARVAGTLHGNSSVLAALAARVVQTTPAHLIVEFFPDRKKLCMYLSFSGKMVQVFPSASRLNPGLQSQT